MTRRLAGLAFVTAVLLSGCISVDEEAARPESVQSVEQQPSAEPAREVAPCPDLPRQEPVEGGLPPLTLPCLGEGPDVRLSDLRGKPTVVNVWAAWCVNCDREMPLFAAAKDQLGDQVQFFGIHYKADRGYGLQSQADFGVPFPSVHDEDGDKVVSALHATAPPYTFFVDADGTIVGREIGEIRSEQELLGLIERHLSVRA